jgi:hypothetical protein
MIDKVGVILQWVGAWICAAFIIVTVTYSLCYIVGLIILNLEKRRKRK